MDIIALKGCAWCGGDLASSRDVYGRYERCLQCARPTGAPEPLPLVQAFELRGLPRTPIRGAYRRTQNRMKVSA